MNLFFLSSFLFLMSFAIKSPLVIHFSSITFAIITIITTNCCSGNCSRGNNSRFRYPFSIIKHSREKTSERNLLDLYGDGNLSISPAFVGISFDRSIQCYLIRAYTVFLFVQIGPPNESLSIAAIIVSKASSINLRIPI